MIIGMFIVYGIFSLISFTAYAEDKRRAINESWRISERALLLVSLLGGAPGALIAMRVFHHKTRKWYFWATGIVGILIQLAIIGYAIYAENFA